MDKIDNDKYEYSGSRLLTNSLVAGGATGLAVLESSGLMFPAAGAAVVGGFVNYLITNEIPKIKRQSD